jgi:uncharacterized protein with FMN-binding domain
MKKYFITFAAIAILGMLVIYYGPTAFKSGNPAKTGGGPLASSAPTQSTTANSSTTTTAVQYKNGTYTGSDAQNPYGDVQISIVINGGKITTVNLLTMPNAAERSQYLSSQAGPLLQSQTISAQSAQIDGVSGATYTSQSYQQSLQSALDQAKAA